MLIEMKVFALTIDPITNIPILILKDLNNKKTLSICIGLLEANIIATAINKINFSRPMTHDLIYNILYKFNIKLIKIEISSSKKNILFAFLYLEKQDNCVRIDLRPSDAIIIALKNKVPIFVDKKIINQFKHIDFYKEVNNFEFFEKDDFKEFLEDLSWERFGKYKM